jgi:hypothetical protein
VRQELRTDRSSATAMIAPLVKLLAVDALAKRSVATIT